MTHPDLSGWELPIRDRMLRDCFNVDAEGMAASALERFDDYLKLIRQEAAIFAKCDNEILRERLAELVAESRKVLKYAPNGPLSDKRLQEWACFGLAIEGAEELLK